MKDVKINYLAVVLAAVLYWLLGAMWFTVFANPWLAGIGKTMEQLKQQNGNSPMPYIVALACNLVLAYVLAADGIAGRDTGRVAVARLRGHVHSNELRV